MASAFLLPSLQCGLQPQMVLEVGHVVTCFLVKTGVGLEVGNNREHVSFKHCECTTNGQLHLSAGSHASATHLSLEARKRAGIPTVPKLQRK